MFGFESHTLRNITPGQTLVIGINHSVCHASLPQLRGSRLWHRANPAHRIGPIGRKVARMTANATPTVDELADLISGAVDPTIRLAPWETRPAARALLERFWPLPGGDEHHTLEELYEYRMLYNALAANAWARQGTYPVVKSWRHSDGEECFGGGWFIVVATLPTGQVSNHYAAEHWNLFAVPAVETPPEYDGHDPAEAARRMSALLSQPTPTAEPEDEGLCDCGEPYATCAAARGRLLQEMDRTDSPRIEDMTPGTTFVAQTSLPERTWHLFMVTEHASYIDGSTLRFYRTPGDQAFVDATIDPSTIRDVTPPAVGR